MENNLQKILDEQGRKYGWLAEQVGINRNTVTNLINGAEPKLKVAYRIAKVLGVSIYDIWPDIY